MSYINDVETSIKPYRTMKDCTMSYEVYAAAIIKANDDLANAFIRADKAHAKAYKKAEGDYKKANTIALDSAKASTKGYVDYAASVI